jgi:hypothetical protein
MNGVEFARSLFERLDEAVYVDPVTDPTWQGDFNKCHENVDRWIALHPEDRSVRGYLVVSATEFSALFDLHSVVERKGGPLIDVTPLRYRLRFIQCSLSDNQFEACKRYFNQLPYIIEGVGYPETSACEDDLPF